MPKVVKPFASKCPRINECRFAVRDTNFYEGRRYMMCGYILITGEPRGCPADKCDKFLPKTRYRRRGMTIIYRKDDLK
jgi:hypothetical protein